MKKLTNEENLVLLAEKKLSSNLVAQDSKWFWDYLKGSKKQCVKQINNIFKLSKNLSINKPSIIDIGSAPFLLPISLQLSNKFSNVAAMDIDPYRFNNIEKIGIVLYKVNLDDPSLSNIKEKFDIIYFSHVFEHLRINLILSMKFLKNILKSDGIIYVETPNSYSLIGWYNKLFKGISTGCSNDLFHEWSKLEKLGHMGHVREYSLSELNAFFKKLNFKIINKGYCGTYASNNFLQTTIKILQKLFPPLKNNIYFVLKKIDN